MDLKKIKNSLGEAYFETDDCLLYVGDSLELMKKIDSLIDQNKLIARGVVMLHEKGLGEGATGTREEIPTPTTSSQITIVKPQTKGVEGYQKSIS